MMHELTEGLLYSLLIQSNLHHKLKTSKTILAPLIKLGLDLGDQADCYQQFMQFTPGQLLSLKCVLGRFSTT